MFCKRKIEGFYKVHLFYIIKNRTLIFKHLTKLPLNKQKKRQAYSQHAHTLFAAFSKGTFTKILSYLLWFRIFPPEQKGGFAPFPCFLEQKVFAAFSYGSNLMSAAWSQTMSINAFLNKHIQSTKPWCFAGCILFHLISFSTRTKSEQSAQPGTAKDLLHSNFFILLVAGWRW